MYKFQALFFFLLSLGGAWSYRLLLQDATLPPNAPIFVVGSPILVGFPPEQAHPSGCPDIDEATIDPTTLMPTEGWTPIFTLDVEPGAVRNFTCNPDLTLSDIVTGRLNFTVTTPPFDWFGSAYNDGISSLPRFDVNDRVTGEFLGTYWMDTGRANYPSPLGPETFSWARWRTFMIRGNVPWSAVVTRTNTEGGGPPETCTTPGEAVISVPFTAQYTFWTC